MNNEWWADEPLPRSISPNRGILGPSGDQVMTRCLALLLGLSLSVAAYAECDPRKFVSHLELASRGLVSSSYLDSAFAVQSRLPSWAEPAEAMILSRIAGAPNLRLSVLEVDCRGTICHLHFVFPSVEYRKNRGNRLVADALDELPGFHCGGKIIPARDGEPTIDYYRQWNGFALRQ